MEKSGEELYASIRLVYQLLSGSVQNMKQPGKAWPMHKANDCLVYLLLSGMLVVYRH